MLKALKILALIVALAALVHAHKNARFKRDASKGKQEEKQNAKKKDAYALAASDGTFTGFVRLAWTPDKHENRSGYKVYRADAIAGPYVEIASVAGIETATFDDTTAAPGVVHAYKIASFRALKKKDQVFKPSLPDTGFANTPPVALGQDASLDEDTSLAITLAGTDNENDRLAYTVTSAPAHGTLSGTAPALVYTPAANYNGPDHFAFTVSDGKSASEPATVAIAVNPVNDAPSDIALDPAAPVVLDNSLPGTTLARITGTDIDNDALCFALAGDPSACFAVQRIDSEWVLTVAQGAVFDFRNAPVLRLTLRADDGNNGTYTEAFQVQVRHVNLAPVAEAALPDGQTLAVGASISLSGSGSYDPDAWPQDLAYAWAIVSQPEGSDIALDLADPIHPAFTPLLAGTYTFRLTVTDGAATDEDTVSVVVEDPAPALPIPVLTSPANGTVFTQMHATLAWQAMPGGYWVEVQVLYGATTVQEALVPDNSYVANFSEPGLHTWRVRAYEPASGRFGDWSAPFNLTVGKPVAAKDPKDGLSYSSLSPTLSWYAMPGVALYEVEVIQTGTETPDMPIDALGTLRILTSSTSTIVDLSALGSGTYSWRVRSVDTSNGAFGAWSDARTLSAGTALRLKDPRSGTVYSDLSPMLYWYLFPGVQYELEVSKNGIGPVYTQLLSTTETTVDISASGPGTYTWRVRPYDPRVNAYGEWSETRAITVGAPITLRDPRNGRTLATLSPRLYWYFTSGVQYELEVSKVGIGPVHTQLFANSISDAVIDLSAFGAGTYSWRVRGYDADVDAYGEWSLTGPLTLAP